MKSYTIGPWEVVGDNTICAISMEDATPEVFIAEVHGDNSGNPRLPNDSQKWANARLVAAAPDMFELLEKFLLDSENRGIFDSDLYKRAQQVVRYARGDE